MDKNMDKKKKKLIFSLIIIIATIILITVGSTFAYFSSTMSSEENAINFGAATFKLDLDDDTSLIKGAVIPSAEKYVDIASTRVDDNGDFLKPYEEDGKLITAGTACIDDNLNEICSIYTFTIKNTMTDYDLPLYVTLHPAINSFTNLYFKVLDKDKKEVISATPLIDDRPYEEDDDGNKIYDENSKITPVVLENINKILPKAPDENTPSEVTYSIVLWIMETGENQTEQDSNQVFGGTLHVNTSGADGNGITGVFSAGGVE